MVLLLDSLKFKTLRVELMGKDGTGKVSRDPRMQILS